MGCPPQPSSSLTGAPGRKLTRHNAAHISFAYAFMSTLLGLLHASNLNLRVFLGLPAVGFCPLPS